MTERFRRPNFGQLEIDVTIDDPKAYTKPFTVRVSHQLMVDQELIEFICNENEKSSRTTTNELRLGRCKADKKRQDLGTEYFRSNEMKAYWIFAALGLGALLAQGTVSAHHSFAAEFDRNQKVTITGSVTKVEWENPHARFYVDSKDEGSGEIVNWDFELASPNGLMRRGWTRNSMASRAENTHSGTICGGV